MTKKIAMEGWRSGRLVAFEHLGTRTMPGGQQVPQWRCLCDCGRSAVVAAPHIRSGHSQSCGCLAVEKVHGQVETGAYRSWQAMKARCLNPTHQAYGRYGGAGVTIHQSWIDSFQSFLADVGERPAGTTLDRYPDKAGNYAPGNVRWATDAEQQNNRSDNILIGGRTLSDAARACGLQPRTVQRRRRLGWPQRDWLLPVGARSRWSDAT